MSVSTKVMKSAQTLKIEGLAGVRGYTILFQDLGFSLQAGEFAVLKGPNGSGKTTLLRLIAGLIRPEVGSISLPDEVGEKGPFYLGHDHGLRFSETAKQHLRDWADMHNTSRNGIAPALERVGLAGKQDVPAYALSAGQKKRVGLARALIVPRTLWLLDEPAAALDTSGQELLCGLLKEHLANDGLCLAALHDPLAIEPDKVLDLSKHG